MNGSTLSDEQKGPLYGRIYEHIHRSLKSDGYDLGEIRGTLVRLNENRTDWGFAQYSYYPYDYATSQRVEAAWSSVIVENNIAAAMTICVIIGFILSLVAMFFLTRVMRSILSHKHSQDAARRAVMLGKLGLDPADDPDQDEATVQGGGNPWCVPCHSTLGSPLQPSKQAQGPLARLHAGSCRSLWSTSSSSGRFSADLPTR